MADEVSEDDCIDLTSEGTPSEADTIILSTDDEDTDDDEAEKEKTATGGDKLPRQDTGDSSSSDWYKYPESSDDEDAMSRFAREIADLRDPESSDDEESMARAAQEFGDCSQM